MNSPCPVSVIIPCYCCAATLERAIVSVINQTVLPQEIILVDDLSPDGGRTRKKMEELRLQYSSQCAIRTVFPEKHGGPSGARNAGWELASQAYIAFLDADDSWHPEKLRIQYEYMKNNPSVDLCGHRCIWLRKKQTPPKLPLSPKTTKIRVNSLLFKNAFSMPTVMLRKDISFRFRKGKCYAEDLLLWQQIAFAGLQMMRIESPLTYVHKPLYGGSGLSAQLWKMECGELENISDLMKEKKIGRGLFLAAFSFSLLKFFKRLAVTLLRSLRESVFRDRDR